MVDDEAINENNDTAQPKEIAEIIQKIYLGVVNGVLTAEEARAIINEAGANLPNGNTNSLNNETETVEENTQEELA